MGSPSKHGLCGPNEDGKYCFCLSFPPYILMVWVIASLIATGCTLAVLFPVLIYKMGGDGIDTAVEKSEIRFLSAVFTNPRPDRITVTNSLELRVSGGYDSTLLSTVLTLSYKGYVLGRLTAPDVFVPEYQPYVIFNFTSDLFIDNVTLAQQMAYNAVSKEELIYLRMTGRIDIKVKILGSHVTYSNRWFDKTTSLPQFHIEDLKSFNSTGFVGHNESTLTFQAFAAFNNTSPLGGQNLGNFLFEFLSYPELVKIGYSYQPNFNLSYGYNSALTILSSDKNSNNSEIINRIFSQYSMGMDQYGIIRGPINADANPAYLLNTIEREILLVGSSAGPLVLGASILSLKNVAQRTLNPIDTTIIQSELISYGYSNLKASFSVPSKSLVCNMSNSLGYSTPGDSDGNPQPTFTSIPPYQVATINMVAKKSNPPTTEELCAEKEY